jgi:HEAT repeat protein
MQFGPQAKAAAAALCRLLEDQGPMGWQTRRGVIHALERIEADGAVVIPVLARALNDNDEMVRRMATNSFLKLDPVAAAEAGVSTFAPAR